ncbi:B3/4 domain-containing protein [Sarcina sp. JB2]|uniref:B3/4 domain-containing protein n=1 Tax=Candidatus Sarcina troglodytae TaxID=2726954 RepID=A0ACD1BCF7_9CLOT|nr:B3/4 domain-containing protein [Sarcina sp. JB2]QPJ85099.1 B3/4 domain-containing protein [Sarcina sp. JB2]
MKKIIIENDFWDIFPEVKIGIVVCRGINNFIQDDKKYENMILNAEKEAMNYLENANFSDNEVIKVWRDAFKKFKTKKGARASIEALLKRIYNGNHLGTINPLVDIYNSISLSYALPCGGEDIDKFVGDIRLTKAVGNENFITLGSNENAQPYEGEIVYKDDKGAICRCLNWRESVRTMLTENTKNAILCMELVDNERIKDLKNALEELGGRIKDNLGGTYKIEILDINNKSTEIE